LERVPAKPSRAALVAAFATIYLVWGSTYLAIRVAVASIPPWIMAGARFVVAGVILSLFLWWRGEKRPTVAQCRDHAIAGGFLLIGGNGLVTWAEQTVPSGATALVIGVTPLFMVLTEWAWPGGVRPRAGTFGALAVGLAGVVWLAEPWAAPVHGGLPVAGVAGLIVACISWSIGSIHSRNIKSGASLPLGSALQMLAGGIGLLMGAGLRGEFGHFDPRAVPAGAWLAWAYLILAGSLVGYSTFVWLIRHSTPARVATYAWVNPVVAVLLGWLFLDETVTARTFGAAAVIVAAVALITTQRSERGRSQQVRDRKSEINRSSEPD
jgi:drug/metabolite transporter (DMT)-like permease